MSDLKSYLNERHQDTILRHRSRKNFLRRASWALHIGAMIAGGGSTVLLGLKVEGDWYQSFSRNGALILGALVTLLTGLLTFWNLDAYWIQRKIILNELEALKEQFDWLVIRNPPDLDSRLEEIFEKYSTIIGKRSQYWEGVLPEVSSSRSTGNAALGS